MPGLIVYESKDERGEMSGDVNALQDEEGTLEEKVMNWENLILSLNNMNIMEKEDRKISYVKYKLFKRDIYMVYSFSKHRKFSEWYFSVQ